MKKKVLQLIFLALLQIPLVSLASTPNYSELQEKQLLHARELMGKSYQKSVVSKHFKSKKRESHIFSLVQERVPRHYRHQARQIAHIIFQEARHHAMDPYFILAVIAGESNFDPAVVGPVGEVGLMQIRPSTGKWISEMLKIKWRGENALKDPVYNIKLGAAYFSWLRNKFQGQGQLYLAAYNMGAKSVENAVARNIYPKDYPRHVMKRYIAFYKSIGKGPVSL